MRKVRGEAIGADVWVNGQPRPRVRESKVEGRAKQHKWNMKVDARWIVTVLPCRGCKTPIASAMAGPGEPGLLIRRPRRTVPGHPHVVQLTGTHESGGPTVLPFDAFPSVSILCSCGHETSIDTKPLQTLATARRILVTKPVEGIDQS